MAVAEVLRARGHEVMLFVSEKEIDALALSGHSDFRFEKLPTIGLPSPFSPAIFGFLRRFNESLSLCRSIYRKFKPQVVLGMGGFTSTAPVLAGRMRGVSDFHSRIQRDSRKGEPADRANGPRGPAWIQRMRAVLSEGAHRSHGHADSRRNSSGLIERSRARSSGLREDLAHSAGDGRKPGREWNQSGDDQVAAALADVPLQVIHLSGARDERLVADNYQRENIPAYVAAFHHRMEEVYSAADFAVARSGAASLAELAFFGLPSILIPFPYAAEDHQTRNAEIFARAERSRFAEGIRTCR